MRRLADDKMAAITYCGKVRSRIASRLARCWPLLLIIGLSHIAAAQQTAAEKLGRQIYVRGAGSGKESISAFMGDESMSIPASALPCASCHGDDGAGRPEGGVAPSDVRWQTLTKTTALPMTAGARIRPTRKAL